MAERKPLFQAAAGFSEEMATGDTATFGGLTLSGDIAMGSNEVTGLPATPSGNTAATSKQYVDSLTNGLKWKEPARLLEDANIALTGEQTIDGSLTSTDRVLLVGQTSADENGLWVTAAGAWARPADFPTAGEAANAAAFVSEGTTYADSAWVCTADSPNDIIDTDTLPFVQFAGNNTVIGGDGIDVSGQTVSVDLAANSGLEFASALLRIDVADTNELSLDANGLNVEGVPTLFNIGATPVGATVTAPNLDTLTDGSNADALHVHTAAPATEALVIENDLTTTDALANGDPCYWDATNDQVAKATAGTDAQAWVIGLARGAIGAAATGPVVSHGIAAGVIAAATAGTPYYMGAAGGLTTTVPGAGNRVVQMGFAVNATDLWVKIHDFGKKAA